MNSKIDEVSRRLVHVRYAVAAIAEAEHGLADAVRHARAAGATWSQIEGLLHLRLAMGDGHPDGEQELPGGPQ
jgi:hypothetical protein